MAADAGALPWDEDDDDEGRDEAGAGGCWEPERDRAPMTDAPTISVRQPPQLIRTGDFFFGAFTTVT